MTAGCKATHKCNDFAFLSTMFSEYDFFMQTILIYPEIVIISAIAFAAFVNTSSALANAFDKFKSG